MANTGEDQPMFPIPQQFCRPPPLQDDLLSATSEAQQDTIEECLPLLTAALSDHINPFDFNESGVPELRIEDHIDFLRGNLSQFPARFVGLDASRPWLVYWGLMGLYFLGEDVEPMRRRYVRQRTVLLRYRVAGGLILETDLSSVKSTFYALQNRSGGFGGGQGHQSHLATTYGTLLSIALVGGESNYALIDREAMWHWLGRLKQASGGFQICEGGEEDTRGAYCALVIISLLSLPVDLPPDAPSRAAGFTTFNDGLGEYISRCQTYEGGISGTPGNEAHGAYVFCALGCLCLLGDPDQTLPRFLDLDALIWWLSSRQYAPEGGIAGRTNKLVDGCYSHWLGACWPMVQATLNGPCSIENFHGRPNVGDLYSAEGLARYILCCCQASPGGLRDKPSKNPDSYHTCYTLSGLSTTQHYHCYESSAAHTQFDSAFSWRSARKTQEMLFEDGARVRSMHPLYAIPHASVGEIRGWSSSQI